MELELEGSLNMYMSDLICNFIYILPPNIEILE